MIERKMYVSMIKKADSEKLTVSTAYLHVQIDRWIVTKIPVICYQRIHTASLYCLYLSLKVRFYANKYNLNLCLRLLCAVL